MGCLSFPRKRESKKGKIMTACPIRLGMTVTGVSGHHEEIKWRGFRHTEFISASGLFLKAILTDPETSSG